MAKYFPSYIPENGVKIFQNLKQTESDIVRLKKMCSEAPGRYLSITIIVLILELYGLLMPQQLTSKIKFCFSLCTYTVSECPKPTKYKPNKLNMIPRYVLSSTAHTWMEKTVPRFPLVLLKRVK